MQYSCTRKTQNRHLCSPPNKLLPPTASTVETAPALPPPPPHLQHAVKVPHIGQLLVGGLPSTPHHSVHLRHQPRLGSWVLAQVIHRPGDEGGGGVMARCIEGLHLQRGSGGQGGDGQGEQRETREARAPAAGHMDADINRQVQLYGFHIPQLFEAAWLQFLRIPTPSPNPNPTTPFPQTPLANMFLNRHTHREAAAENQPGHMCPLPPPRPPAHTQTPHPNTPSHTRHPLKHPPHPPGTAAAPGPVHHPSRSA